MLTHCPACGLKNIITFLLVNDYEIWRCMNCGTSFVHNIPSTEELTSIYSDSNYYELPKESVQRIKNENRRRLKTIRKFISGKNFLDIGCARGLLLDEASRAGFNTYGIELSPRNAELSSKKGHLVFNGNLNRFAHINKDSKFDIITCLDVIEHVENPFEFIKVVASLLSCDGVMVLSTPNFSGLVSKKLAARGPYMTPPEHLTFFTAAGIRALVTRCNLVEVHHTNFGILTVSEIERSINYYLPWLWKPIHPFIKVVVNGLFSISNYFGIGLEQEIYLKKTDRT